MAFEVAYSRPERLFHRIAFSGRSVQLTAEDIESSLYGKQYRHVDPSRPVFITSLPRAGTTMMLEVLAGLPDFATTTYRDMPFVLAPLIWSKLSGRFQTEGSLRERAHGDGIEIGYDSPEGFEEVFWKAHWPGHYGKDGLSPWRASDAEADATAFLRRHMQKIIALRRGEGASARYLSKNNANIARLDLLGHMTDAPRILLVLRDPLEHAASMHRQHVNFMAQHDSDAFALRYMGDVGHYEFGALHRPIRFDGFDGLVGDRAPEDPSYWLAYWIAAFRNAVEHAEQVTVVAFEALTAAPETGLAQVLDGLDVEARDGIQEAAARLRPQKARADRDGFAPELVAEAREIHADLRARACNQ